MNLNLALLNKNFWTEWNSYFKVNAEPNIADWSNSLRSQLLHKMEHWIVNKAVQYSSTIHISVVNYLNLILCLAMSEKYSLASLPVEVPKPVFRSKWHQTIYTHFKAKMIVHILLWNQSTKCCMARLKCCAAMQINLLTCRDQK